MNKKKVAYILMACMVVGLFLSLLKEASAGGVMQLYPKGKTFKSWIWFFC